MCSSVSVCSGISMNPFPDHRNNKVARFPVFWTKKVFIWSADQLTGVYESMTTHRQTIGRHDNSATAIFHRQPTRQHNHWPTRQVTDNFFKYSQKLTDRAFPRKGVKINISYNVNIALFSETNTSPLCFQYTNMPLRLLVSMVN